MVLPFTLQQLTIIKAVATESSFTKAAEILFISQPSLSKQLKTLENRLGIQLINRYKNQISLSEAGELLVQYSERILALCDESCRALNDLKIGQRGILRIGTTQNLATYFIPRVLALFTKNYPQINFKLQIEPSKLITKTVIDRLIDIAVIEDYIPKFLKKELQIENFIEEELHLIVSKSHSLISNKKKIIKKADLYDLNFIVFNDDSTVGKFIDIILIRNNIKIKELNITLELSSLEAIKTAVSLDLGVAFISSLAIKNEIELKTLEIIQIENIKLSYPIYIITNLERNHSKAFEFFYNQLLTSKNIIKKLKANNL
jgi:DNA-binding transcriptional LysR family regulator